MVCRNCGNETGTRRDCTACGFDPTKDDPAVQKRANNLPTKVTLPPIEVVLKKKANIPAIIGFVCSILMYIPIPIVGWFTCPAFYIAAAILAIVGFCKAKACRSGRGFAITSLILCVLLVLLIVGAVLLVIALGGVGILAELLAAIGINAFAENMN